ncbi:hypothetical protein HD554DRAFT_927998 [Boletus coccyginus]|nr:hypothetical protein HD554DRAFT_927998 [Boletus coccyginus]
MISRICTGIRTLVTSLTVPSTDNTLFVANASKAGAAASPFVPQPCLRSASHESCRQRRRPGIRSQSLKFRSLCKFEDLIRPGCRTEGARSVFQSRSVGRFLASVAQR